METIYRESSEAGIRKKRSGSPPRGFTPQFLNTLGGYRIQGKTKEAAEKILSQAKDLEKAGAFAIVLEMVPQDCAKLVTRDPNNFVWCRKIL